VTGSELKLTMVLEMAGEKDVERITVFFKSLGKWETKESSISVVEKAIIKECSRKFLKFWMLSKEDQANEKERLGKEKKELYEFLSADNLDDYEDTVLVELMPSEDFYGNLVREAEIPQAKNLTMDRIMEMIEKSIEIKAEKAGILDLWKSIVRSQNADVTNIRGALETLKKEVIPDLRFFVAIRKNLAGITQKQDNLKEYARRLVDYFGKIRIFCSYFQVEDWELKEVEIYCQFINGMDHGSRELFVETIVPAICLALKKQPIGLSWNDVVEALDRYSTSLLTPKQSFNKIGFKKEKTAKSGKIDDFVPLGFPKGLLEEKPELKKKCLFCGERDHRHYECGKWNPNFQGRYEKDHPYYNGVPENVTSAMAAKYAAGKLGKKNRA